MRWWKDLFELNSKFELSNRSWLLQPGLRSAMDTSRISSSGTQVFEGASKGWTSLAAVIHSHFRRWNKDVLTTLRRDLIHHVEVWRLVSSSLWRNFTACNHSLITLAEWATDIIIISYASGLQLLLLLTRVSMRRKATLIIIMLLQLITLSTTTCGDTGWVFSYGNAQ